MLFRLFIFNFYSFWIINQGLMVYSVPKSDLYLKYVIDVFNHIRIQDGWDLEEACKIKIGENSHKVSFNEILTKAVDKSNFSEKIPLINNLINLKYTEILKVFNIILDRFIQKCYNYKKDERYEVFIKCSLSLQKTLENSKDMLSKFSRATEFLSNINEKLTVDYGLELNSIDKQFRIINQQSSTISINKYDTVYVSLKNMETFQIFCNTIKNKIIELDMINEKWCCFNNNSVLATLLTLYGVQYDKNPATDRVENIFNNLKTLYEITIQNDFYNLGFTQLIYSTANGYIKPPFEKRVKKVSYSKPPLKRDREDREFKPNN
ncbi:uncharacterized protein LOC126908432 [Daktulosphaira vitifoliae]|uniref:uncharacterized protein LOC126908432 n=1 Tax=Daktulosphaira vitifoliae TaxID=58002 RepID=UPI0021AA11A9|nr:uncharacterized protein LOC126908432 [Daktulosphaira vitifoliae]